MIPILWNASFFLSFKNILDTKVWLCFVIQKKFFSDTKNYDTIFFSKIENTYLIHDKTWVNKEMYSFWQFLNIFLKNIKTWYKIIQNFMKRYEMKLSNLSYDTKNCIRYKMKVSRLSLRISVKQKRIKEIERFLFSITA